MLEKYAMLMLLERTDHLISRVYIPLQTRFIVFQQKIWYMEQSVKWLNIQEWKDYGGNAHGIQFCAKLQAVRDYIRVCIL